MIIATEWKEFKTIDWQAVYNGMNKPAFVFDGRLLVDVDALKKIGFKVGTISFPSCYQLFSHNAPTGYQHWPRRRDRPIKPDLSTVSAAHSCSFRLIYCRPTTRTLLLGRYYHVVDSCDSSLGFLVHPSIEWPTSGSS